MSDTSHPPTHAEGEAARRDAYLDELRKNREPPPEAPAEPRGERIAGWLKLGGMVMFLAGTAAGGALGVQVFPTWHLGLSIPAGVVAALPVALVMRGALRALAYISQQVTNERR